MDVLRLHGVDEESLRLLSFHLQPEQEFEDPYELLQFMLRYLPWSHLGPLVCSWYDTVLKECELEADPRLAAVSVVLQAKGVHAGLSTVRAWLHMLFTRGDVETENDANLWFVRFAALTAIEAAHAAQGGLQKDEYMVAQAQAVASLYIRASSTRLDEVLRGAAFALCDFASSWVWSPPIFASALAAR